MSTRIGPTTEQALAGAIAGHRMAGMEPTDSDIEIARRQLSGEISADAAVREAIATAIDGR